MLKKNDCLQTPEWVVNELGVVDLDPCAALNTSIGTTNYRLEDGECGLSKNWFGFVYCNPPFFPKREMG